MSAPLNNPALLVIDMQNDFVREGAPLECAAARDTIPAIGDLLAGFREQGRPVVFTRYVADALYRPLGNHLPWIRLLDPPVNACVPGFMRHYPDIGGSRQAVDVIDELEPIAGEAVVDKVYYSAFHRTDLDRRLAEAHVDSLVMVGTVAEMCVEDTARHAVHFGYPTVIVSDAVSSSDAPTCRNTLDIFARNYGWVMTAEEVLASMEETRLRQAAG